MIRDALRAGVGGGVGSGAGELPLPSLDIARLDPDRIGARAAQYSKVQESSAHWAPRSASRGVLDVRGTSDNGRTRKLGSDRIFVHRM